LSKDRPGNLEWPRMNADQHGYFDLLAKQTMWRTSLLGWFMFIFVVSAFAREAPVCSVAEPTVAFSVRHLAGHPALTTDPQALVWKSAASQTIVKDCSREIEYTNTRSTARAFWTDTDLYFLFECPYTDLNLFLPPNHTTARVGLWDRDVVEMFLGDDWNNIRHYREFEIAPTGDWIDLAIDLDHESNDHSWRSGWKTAARIDDQKKVWYAAARIPLASVSTQKVRPGTRWRMNLYRIDGLGADPQRHFLCWQPTCVQNRDPNHVPEHFGTLVFEMGP
jgi:Carbohydrate family 9 binding domain-like